MSALQLLIDDISVPQQAAEMKTNTLGERLANTIKERGMTNAELGRRSGVSKQNIGLIVRGVARGGQTPDVLFALADALGIHARWLAFGIGPKERTDIIDQAVLSQMLIDAIDADKSLGSRWSQRELIRVAVAMYSIWAKSGERPNVAHHIELLSARQKEA